jgi:excisionase family DNA binding protein
MATGSCSSTKGVRPVDQLLTIKEVSKVLRTNPTTVYKIIKAGRLTALKLGSLKVRQASLEQFLAQHDGMDLSDLNNIKQMEV